jgi:maltooligosyltrehalose trehalohydrolase
MSDFSVWAPRPGRVDLVLSDDRVLMRQGEDGWWRVSADAEPEATYGYSLDGGPARPDPRGLRLPDGPQGLSQRFDVTAFEWTDSSWRGVALPDAVLYELHVGTFTEEGTLDAAAERLPHLVALGVTLVELLPLAPFPGRHGWGYDGVAPYAVHEPYGGPAALQRFVDAAHAAGLGVCLDVVYNHLGPDGNYLAQFGPYLTDRHHTPWGEALNLDAPGSDEVRAWVLDNVTSWFRGFHVDALRLDAVHELRDDRAVHVLEEIAARTDALSARLGRPLWLAAESDRNDPRTVTPRQHGGLGVHSQWADDVHHALHVALTGETHGYYADFTAPGALAKVMRTPFFHDGTLSTFRGRHHGRPVDPSTPGWRFVAGLQTHDQVGNRAVGDRLSASLSPGRLACGAAILLTAPWTPMLFMGEEWGASTPWQFFTDHTDPGLAEAVRHGRRAEFAAHGWAEADVPDPQDPETMRRSRLDWAEREKPPHDRLLRWYTDLLRLRRDEPDLRDGRLDRAEVAHDPLTGTFTMRRGAVTVLVNLADRPRTVPVGAAGQAGLALAWDSEVAVRDGSLTLPAESAAVVVRR